MTPFCMLKERHGVDLGLDYTNNQVCAEFTFREGESYCIVLYFKPNFSAIWPMAVLTQET